MAKNNNLTDLLTDVANAIRAKKGTTAKINPQDFSSEISSIVAGGGSQAVLPNDVIFIDYDGTIIYSYTAEEFLALSSLPPQPAHAGLTGQGWNYTLSDAQAYVRNYGILDIGGFYITDDGKTRLYITIPSDGRMNVPLVFTQTVSNGVTIDWGDGSSAETIEGTGRFEISHSYSAQGDYCISLGVASGCTLTLGRNSADRSVLGPSSVSENVYNRFLRRVEFGSNVTTTGSYAFQYCYSLQTVTMPKSITKVGEYCFRDCFSLSSITFSGSIGNSGFDNCKSLSYVSVKSTSSENYTFQDCTALKSFTVVSGKTTLRTYLSGCSSLSRISLPSTVNNIWSSLQGCKSLLSVVIPSKITTLYDNAFNGCNSLTSLVVPPTIKTINGRVFAGCFGMKYYDFSSHTSVPTLGTNAFTNIAGDCQIIVPYQLYNEWKSATNWSTWEKYIVMNYTPQECISLSIEADNLTYGNSTTAKVRWTAITNGVLRDGTNASNVTVTGESEVYVGSNSTNGVITKEVSYTYLGVTATTTITQGAYLDNSIICKYDVTSTSSATTLLYSQLSNFSTMIIDGEEMTAASSYTFSSLGEHEVAFKVADGLVLSKLYMQFRGCSTLVEADCSSIDLSSVETTTSSGTAWMFYDCKKLKKVILPDSVAHLGYYMFYGCVALTDLTIRAINAPAMYGPTTFGNSAYFMGYTTRQSGENILRVPIGALGYDAANWTNYVYSTSYCGFTKIETNNI